VHSPLRITAIADRILDEWEIYSALRHLNKPVELVYLPDGVHELVKPLERFNSLEGNVEWFSFWLQGYQDTDPAKAPQYEPWRALSKLRRSN